MSSNQAQALLPFFKKIPLFAGLEADELTDILRSVQSVSIKEGETLFSEGDQGDAAYVIEAGRVEVVTRLPGGGEVKVAELGASEVMGELALLDGAQRTASIRAIEDTRLIKIQGGEFNYLRRNRNKAAYKLIRAMALMTCERLRETNDRITELLEPAEETDAKRDGQPQEPEETHKTLLGRLLSWRRS